jgi:type VI secretion system protein VasJ
MLATDTLLPLGTAPIPGENPAGASARYEESFTRLEAEMSKLENPSGGEVDWKAAITDATAILREKSKDLLVGAYLARALLQQHGVEGLAAGLAILQGMTTAFWEGLQPNRPRARRGALEWVSERAAAALDPSQLRPNDLAHVPAALASTEAMWSALADKFEGEDAGLASLRRRLKELGEGAAAGGSAGADGAATSAADAGAGGAGASPRAAAGGPATTRAAAIQRLSEAADYFRRYEPHSPVGYLVGRAMQWSEKSFEDIFAELLKGKKDAQDHIWDALGIPIPPT